MYHNALITKDHPHQAELENAIALILAFSGANSIYFSSHLEDDLNSGIILVIIGKDSPHAWDELTENYWKVFEAFPQFSFRIFDEHWIKEELKDGNPFFAMHCNRNNLVYSTAASKEICYTEKLKSKRFLKKAIARYAMEEHGAFLLGINVKFYLNNNDYLQAAYIIHQNIRWLYVAASRFLTGEWIVTHDLETQQRHVGKFSKELRKAFDGGDEGEAKLLNVLNTACYAVQNGQGIPEITLDMIEAAVAKKEWMRMEVGRLSKECVCRCKYEFSRTKIPLITIDESDPLQLITRIVTDTIEASALYCFGERSIRRSAVSTILRENAIDFENTHYYLFLIVKEYQAGIPGNIAYNIKMQTGGKHTATVVMHSKKSLHQKPGDQQHFFYQIMQRGKLLFQETARPPFLPFEYTPSRNIKSAKMYMQQRERIAGFLQEAEGMDGGGATKVHVFLMHLVVGQTCLGLIRLFLGYTPNHFSLPYLFELCEYFTPLTAEIFPRVTGKDKELLRTLSRSENTLRHGFIDDVPHHDYEVLSNRYNEFVERAGKLAASEIERLAQLNQNNNPNT